MAGSSYGIQRGYEGLLSFNGVVPLGPAEVRGITHLGGTILGTTNRGNPFRYVSRDEHGHEMEIDRSDDLVAAFQASGFDALVSIGGDGSLQISHQLWCKGLPVVCVPKTIDNDVSGTQRTFGFDTAVEHRDRGARQAALHGGEPRPRDGGGADGPLRRLDRALQRHLGQRRRDPDSRDPLRHREGVREDPARGKRRAGASASWSSPRAPGPSGGDIELVERRGVGTVDRLGGIASKVARAIELRTGKETRTLVLGHLQRGGSPTTYDRLLALRFGAAAVRAIADGAFGTMVGLNGPDITRVPLAEGVGRAKNVPLDGDIIATARELGISLGD